jgi:hypothetical protein
MFYSEEQIATNLICPRCKLKLVDPRIIVPCCETLCYNCCDELTDKSDINCPFCHIQHRVPEGGFGVNKMLVQMLSVKPDLVNRSANVEALKEKIGKINDLTDELKSNLACSELIINEACCQVKCEIDLLVEEKKKELDDMRDDHFQRVDSYEQECVKSWRSLDARMFVDGLDQAGEFTHKCKGYLKNFQVDEAVVCQQIVSADCHVAHVEKRLRELKAAQFGEKLLTFKANKSPLKSIGTLEFTKFENSSNSLPLNLSN